MTDYPFCKDCVYEDVPMSDDPCYSCHNIFLSKHTKPMFKARVPDEEQCKGGNDMENASSTAGTLSGSYTYHSCYCIHRLPCGYCQLLSRVCPMQGVTINPYWNEVTCNGNGTGDVK